MLKTYSTKGNTCIIPFTLKTAVSVFSFKAEFKGGDSFGLTGKTKRATFKTKKPMEQFAIESSEMFKKGLVTLDDSVETQAEIKAKAEAAARAMKEENEQQEKEENGSEEPVVEKKPRTKK